MSGHRGKRAILPPASHAGVYQGGIAFQGHLRPDSQSFRDSGSEGLDDYVRLVHHTKDRLDSPGLLQVDGDRSFAPPEFVERPGSNPVYPHDLGPEIRQNHPAEWARCQAGQFDDPDAVQRSLQCRSFFHTVALYGNVTFGPISRICHGKQTRERMPSGCPRMPILLSSRH